jgi:hypothetical protein
MTRDVMTPADLLGRIESINIACTKFDRRGRYWVKTLVRQIGIDGNIANWPSNLSADCPRKNAAAFADRCDVRCPDLRKVAASGGDDALWQRFSNRWPD